jgi:hypothetical protein
VCLCITMLAVLVKCADLLLGPKSKRLATTFLASHAYLPGQGGSVLPCITVQIPLKSSGISSQACITVQSPSYTHCTTSIQARPRQAHNLLVCAKVAWSLAASLATVSVQHNFSQLTM